MTSGDDAIETARRALACLDLTDLSDTCTQEAAAALVKKALTPFGPVAAVCLWPQHVSMAVERLRDTEVAVATVINFPAGGEDIERVVEDIDEALRDGAHEIDLVAPWRALRRGDDKLFLDMISAARDHIPEGRLLKVIIESGELWSDDLIARASDLAISAEAHFIKTSTGKTAVSATPAAARVMLERIKASGRPVGFKASGGVRTLEDAASYLGIARDIMGAQWATPDTFRFGASGLLDALQNTLAMGA
jgi:deoxyribose-phosphate aldolase